jgi:tetratricopeptide (TPR) repeat protein
VKYEDDDFRISPEKLRRFTETRRQLEEERKAAPVIVDLIVAGTPHEKWVSLANHPDLQNVGALDYVGSLFEKLLTKSPVQAGALAELAVQLVQTIPSDAYPSVILAQMKAQALKNYGKYLRFVGQFKAAEDAFRKAERMLGGRGTLDHDRALIRLALAVTLQEMEQFDDSLTLLAECKRAFRDYPREQDRVRRERPRHPRVHRLAPDEPGARLPDQRMTYGFGGGNGITIPSPSDFTTRLTSFRAGFSRFSRGAP